MINAGGRLKRAAAVGMLVLQALALSSSLAGEAGFRDWRSLRDAQLVRQSRDYTCGLAALATLLRHAFGRNVSEAGLLRSLENEIAGDGNSGAVRPGSGVSFATLRRLARRHGVDAVGLSLGREGLRHLALPVIAYLEYHGQPHFTVLRGVDPEQGSVHLADPGWGNWRLSTAQFHALWDPAARGRGRILALLPRDGEAAGRPGDYFGVRPRPVLLAPRRSSRFAVP